MVAYSRQQDTDSHQSEKSDTEPHQSENREPDPHKSEMFVPDPHPKGKEGYGFVPTRCESATLIDTIFNGEIDREMVKGSRNITLMRLLAKSFRISTVR